MSPQNKDRGKTSPAIMCIKVLLHIFNFIYLIIGVCVLAIGIFVQVQLKDLIKVTDPTYANAAYVMIGVGLLVMLVAVGGFFCTAKDKIALLYLYGIFISLLAIMQIAAGIAGGVMAKKLTDEINSGLNKSIANHETTSKYWDQIQKKLKCCGIHEPEDWLAYGGIPASCYSDGKIPDTQPTEKPAATTTPSVTTPNITTTAPPTTTTTAPPTTTTTAPPTTTTIAPTTTDTNTTDTNDTTTAITAPNVPPSNDTASSTTVTPAKSGELATAVTGKVDDTRRKRRAAVDTLFDTGCYDEIKSKMHEYLSVIVGVCVGFVILQVLGAVLACCLAKRTSRNNYEQIY